MGNDMRKSIYLLPVAGLLAGWLASLVVTPRYVSTAVIAFAQPDSVGGTARMHHDLVNLFIGLKGDILSRTSLSNLIQRPELNLYADERRSQPLEDVIETMRKAVEIDLVDRPGYSREQYVVFRISLRYSDRFKTQAAVQMLVTRFVDAAKEKALTEAEFPTDPLTRRIGELEARVAALEGTKGVMVPEKVTGMPYTVVSVVDPPSLPMGAEFPDPRWLLGVGLGLGCVVMGRAALVFSGRAGFAR